MYVILALESGPMKDVGERGMEEGMEGGWGPEE